MKSYIKPALRISILQANDICINPGSPTVPIKSTPADDSEVYGRSRRGTWGDLWNDASEE